MIIKHVLDQTLLEYRGGGTVFTAHRERVGLLEGGGVSPRKRATENGKKKTIRTPTRIRRLPKKKENGPGLDGESSCQRDRLVENN